MAESEHAVMYDVLIVGGGPAGLSAALLLGRCRRRVLVCDAGSPRNAQSGGLHGFLSRDGILPPELLRIGREQLAPYGVEFRIATVTESCRVEDHFVSKLEGGEAIESRKLLLATGVVDHLPPIQGIEEYYGKSVFHCPFCDGWELRDRPLAAYGRGAAGAGLAIMLKAWTSDVILFTDGRSRLRGAEAERLRRNQVPVIDRRIERLEGIGGVLERIVLRGGESIPRRGLFFSSGQEQCCDLASRFGCVFTRKGAVRTGRWEAAGVPGLYVAGDASQDVQMVAIAAAEGTRAAIAIHKALEDGIR